MSYCKHGALLTEPCDDCRLISVIAPPKSRASQSGSAITDERERCLELVKRKRDGNMRRTTGGYEPAPYFLNEADVRQACNELIKEIEDA